MDGHDDGRRTSARAGGVLRRLIADRRGVSAVEFALVAPILVLLYFGLVELSQAATADRRLAHATSAVGDLVAQASSVT